MNVKLELYRVFCNVAKTESFSLAAQKLFMSQPAVSQSIKQLEEQLGLQLFNRTSKGVFLTTEGRTLYEYVESGISLIESGERKILHINQLAYGELSIGVGDTISRYLLLPYLERFHQDYPEIKLKIINRTSLDTLSLLRLGKVDVAFVNLPVDGDDIEVKKTFPVQDTFVVGRGLAHLALEPLTPREIAALPLILLERKSNSRLYVERFYLKNGAALNPEIELGSHDLLLEFARINLGVSCVIRQFAQHFLRTGELIELKQTIAVPRRNIALVCHKGMSLSPAAAKFFSLFTGDVPADANEGADVSVRSLPITEYKE